MSISRDTILIERGDTVKRLLSLVLLITIFIPIFSSCSTDDEELLLIESSSSIQDDESSSTSTDEIPMEIGDSVYYYTQFKYILSNEYQNMIKNDYKTTFCALVETPEELKKYISSVQIPPDYNFFNEYSILIFRDAIHHTTILGTKNAVFNEDSINLTIEYTYIDPEEEGFAAKFIAIPKEEIPKDFPEEFDITFNRVIADTFDESPVYKPNHYYLNTSPFEEDKIFTFTSTAEAEAFADKIGISSPYLGKNALWLVYYVYREAEDTSKVKVTVTRNIYDFQINKTVLHGGSLYNSYRDNSRSEIYSLVIPNVACIGINLSFAKKEFYGPSITPSRLDLGVDYLSANLNLKLSNTESYFTDEYGDSAVVIDTYEEFSKFYKNSWLENDFKDYTFLLVKHKHKDFNNKIVGFSELTVIGNEIFLDINLAESESTIEEYESYSLIKIPRSELGIEASSIEKINISPKNISYLESYTSKWGGRFPDEDVTKQLATTYDEFIEIADPEAFPKITEKTFESNYVYLVDRLEGSSAEYLIGYYIKSFDGEKTTIITDGSSRMMGDTALHQYYDAVLIPKEYLRENPSINSINLFYQYIPQHSILY